MTIMKKLFFIQLLLLFLLTQSCDSINLNSKERSIKGYWGQNILIAQIQYEMKGDKTFEAFLASGLMNGVLVNFKGTWKVMDDRFVTDIAEGPLIRTKKGDADLGEALKELGLGDIKIAASGKIIAVDEHDLIVESDGKEVVWKRETSTKFLEMKKKFESWKK